MATADIVLLFSCILVVVFMVIMVKLIMTLQTKIQKCNLENSKRKEDRKKDREEIKGLLRENNKLLREIKAELKEKVE